MNASRWLKLFFVVLVIAIIISMTVKSVDSAAFFPKTMRLQNNVPQVIPPGARTACQWEYVATGDGVWFYPPDTFTISPEYTGALLTVNVEADGWFEIFYVGSGGYFDRLQTLGYYKNYASVAWPIEAIHDLYQVEIYNSGITDLNVKLCRISVQVNR
jgi:hypothetical protein